MSESKSVASKNAKTLRLLIAATIGMTGFAFALVPLYDVFCDLTGLNGKTSNIAVVATDLVEDKSKTVSLGFIAMQSDGVDANFKPEQSSMELHPGKVYSTQFFVRNNTNKAVVYQAVASISPGAVALLLHKTECFCFNQQLLEPGEEKWSPLQTIESRMQNVFPEAWRQSTIHAIVPAPLLERFASIQKEPVVYFSI